MTLEEFRKLFRGADPRALLLIEVTNPEDASFSAKPVDVSVYERNAVNDQGISIKTVILRLTVRDQEGSDA